MPTIDDYVARIEGACGAEKDIIVVFKYDKKDEVVKRILQRAELKNSFSGIVFELQFKEYRFRVYSSGKAIFRSIKDRAELNSILNVLLL